MEVVWYYSADGGTRSGPVAEKALRELFESAAIQPSTLVWRDGMADWAPLDRATGWSRHPAVPPAAVPPVVPAPVPSVIPAASASAPADTTWSDAPHPWRRYFSRSADYLVVGLPVLILLFIPLFAIFGASSPMMKLLSNAFVCQFLLVCLFPFSEAFLLSTWGFTPTRALMGIHIRNADGSKLSYRRALQRSWRVALQGMGLGLPLVVLFTNVAAYNYLKDSKATTWDETLNISVRHRRWGVLRGLAAVLWCLAVLIAAAGLNAMELGK
ncbi:MAG: RDD family protein [Nevskia sp.]|nr:RDD family protein [Nevskia sp.]